MLKQTIRRNQFYSCYVAVSGVPQGGVLSPLLFILYVNDLSSVLTSSKSLLQYADDVKLITSGTELTASLRNLYTEFIQLKLWCNTWGLQLNPQKSKICVFSNKSMPIFQTNRLPYFVDLNIPMVDSVKDLGVILDRKLTFHQHIKLLNNRLRFILGYFWRNLGPLKGSRAIKPIFFAYAQSLIDYALPIWGTASDTAIKPIIATHKRLLKFVLGIHAFDHNFTYAELAKRASIPTIPSRYLYLSSSIFYNIVNTNPINDILTFSIAVPVRRNRSTHFFHIPYKRLTISHKFFTITINKFFNSLPNDFDFFTQNKSSFMCNIKKYI